MAISQMAKIIIVSHNTEITDLLEKLQSSGICQILNAEEAMVSKNWPELGTAAGQTKDTRELLTRLTKTCAFLKNYAQTPKGLAAAFSPRAVIDEQLYQQAVSDKAVLQTLEQAEQAEKTIEKLNNDTENLQGVLDQLKPWAQMETPVEEIGQLETAKCLVGLLPVQKLKQIKEQLNELEAVIDIVGEANNQYACLVVCLKDNLADTQKLLRSADFELVDLPSIYGQTTGTVAKLITDHREKLNQTTEQLQNEYAKASALGEHLLKLQILCDHHSNLLTREQAESESLATEYTVILEGWAKKKDLTLLEKIISQFKASSLQQIEPAEGEDIPVEIDNNKAIKPFELITRLYGMPSHVDVDPTVFLAPFFAIFFGLCMTDVGYGVVMAVILWFMMKKMQGDKGALVLFFICSITTIIAGALTGGWFGDAIQMLLPEGSSVYNSMNSLRTKLMLFDPMKEPFTFFIISLGLGYLQIQCGLLIGFFNGLKQKDIPTAVFNFLTWLILLNSLVLFGVAKVGFINVSLAPLFKWLAIISAILIFLFTERKSGMAGRVGGGVFALFSTVFYFGDILSYVRLMALGMVAAGLGMAINILVKLVMPAPYGLGYVFGALLFVGGHLVNIALGILSSFVHSLRLQFVEFFPKFLVGGGKDFVPLQKSYKHIMVETNIND